MNGAGTYAAVLAVGSEYEAELAHLGTNAGC